MKFSAYIILCVEEMPLGGWTAVEEGFRQEYKGYTYEIRRDVETCQNYGGWCSWQWYVLLVNDHLGAIKPAGIWLIKSRLQRLYERIEKYQSNLSSCSAV